MLIRNNMLYFDAYFKFMIRGKPRRDFDVLMILVFLKKDHNAQ